MGTREAHPRLRRRGMTRENQYSVRPIAAVTDAPGGNSQAKAGTLTFRIGLSFLGDCSHMRGHTYTAGLGNLPLSDGVIQTASVAVLLIPVHFWKKKKEEVCVGARKNGKERAWDYHCASREKAIGIPFVYEVRQLYLLSWSLLAGSCHYLSAGGIMTASVALWPVASAVGGGGWHGSFCQYGIPLIGSLAGRSDRKPASGEARLPAAPTAHIRQPGTCCCA
jgi:hypothetical protein